MTTQGSGELFGDPAHFRRDLATVRRGIREGWDIPEQLLTALPKIVGFMALNANEKTTVRLKAIETLIKMKAQNDSLEPVTQQVDHHHTIEVGQITADNFAESKRKLAERIAALGRRS
jgi:hypothetical protein